MFFKVKGFSLVELLLSLTIIGITVSFIIPGSINLIDSVHGSKSTSLLRISLIIARSEALKRHQIVRLCPSKDGQFCSDDRNWGYGWITYVDLSGKRTRTSNDPILQVQAGIKNMTIWKNGNEHTVRFDRSGKIGLNRSFSICNETSRKPISRIALIHSGRIRITQKKAECEKRK